MVAKNEIIRYGCLKSLRLERGLSQEQLAGELDMHKTTYTNYEQGKHSLPLDMACKLADFYGVSLDYLAGRTDSRETDKTYMGHELYELICSLDDKDRERFVAMIKAYVNV